MYLRLADKKDANSVLAMYQSAKKSPFSVWNDEYPTAFDIENDLSHSGLYVLCDGETLIGAVSKVAENELDGENCWEYAENVCEISRIVIHEDFRGKGYSAVLVSQMLEILKSEKYTAVHLAAAIRNIPAVKNYTRLGFKNKGECDMFGNTYYLLEKKL